jgi:hypothetical protein
MSTVGRVRAVLLIAGLGLSGARSRPLAAQWLGPELQVNGYSTNGQNQPAIAVDAAGRFVVVWESYGQDGAFGSIVARRLGSDGVPLRDEFVVSSSDTEARYTPVVAAGADGGFVVVWVDGSTDGSYSDIRARRYLADATPAGAEFQVNTYTPGYQSAPAVAIGVASSFVVAWRSFEQDGSGYGVFARRFEANGDPAGDEFRVSVASAGSQNLPALAADAAGSFLVVWQSDDGDGSGIVGRRLDAAGAPLAGEFPISLFTTGDQFEPAVAPAGAGSWIVVWSSDGQDGSATGVFGRRIDDSGSVAGGEFAVNSTTAGSQDEPAVASGASGRFVVVWESYSDRESTYDLVGRSFDAAGSPDGDEFAVNVHEPGGQYQPALAARPSGDFVVAWDSYGQDGSYGGIFARRGAPLLFADGFESGSSCGWSASQGGGCARVALGPAPAQRSSKTIPSSLAPWFRHRSRNSATWE